MSSSDTFIREWLGVKIDKTVLHHFGVRDLEGQQAVIIVWRHPLSRGSYGSGRERGDGQPPHTVDSKLNLRSHRVNNGSARRSAGLA